MGKEKKPTASIDDVESPENDELQKSLDENLEAMDKLVKSQDDDTHIEELLKSKKNRKKIREMLDKDEDDEDEEEEQKGESDEDDEEDDEDEDEGYSKKGKGKMKKSFDDIEKSNEEVIDAVPILGKFYSILKSFSDKLDEVASEVKESKKLQKSFSDVLSSTSKLVKSMQDDVESVANQPIPVKGLVKRSDILSKSFGDNEEGESLEKSFSTEVIRETLLKSVQDGSISGSSVAKWELAGYNINVLPKKDLAILTNKLQGGR